MAPQQLLAYEDIVTAIRNERQELGLTQRDLAQQAGIQPQQLHDIENLQLDATYRAIFSIIDALEHVKREQTLTASTIMTNGVTWIDTDTQVEKARQIMYDNDYLQLPVKEEREQQTAFNIGSFSENEINGVDDLSKQVGAVMGPPLPEVAPDTIYKDLEQLFDEGYPAILVVDDTGYTGIVTRTDMRQ